MENIEKRKGDVHIKVVKNEGEDKSSIDTLANPKYVCKSCTLITESLRKGCDVVQMPNGDIMVTETKVVTSRYGWDVDKEKMIKISSEISDGMIKSLVS